MTIYNRPDELVFAEGAKSGEVEDFPNILRGWGEAFDRTGGRPPMEWFNGLSKRTDLAIRYLMQRGVPEWSNTEDYPSGAVVQHGGTLYIALANSTGKTPGASPSEWSSATGSANAGHGQCRLVFVDFETIRLVPHNGNNIVLDGEVVQLPPGGIEAKKDGLPDNTVLYVYLSGEQDNLKLFFSKTAYEFDKHGIAIHIGLSNMTLVGMVYLYAGKFRDDSAMRLVASYFQRRGVYLYTSRTAPLNFSNSALAEISTGVRLNLLVWRDEMMQLGFSGNVSCDTAGSKVSVQPQYTGGTGVAPVLTSSITNANDLAPITSVGDVQWVGSDDIHTISLAAAITNGVGVLQSSCSLFASTRL